AHTLSLWMGDGMSPFGGRETSERWRTRAVTPYPSCVLLLVAAFAGRGAIFKCLALLFGLFALAAGGAGEPAQHFPNKPLTLVVGAAAGGGIDITARPHAGVDELEHADDPRRKPISAREECTGADRARPGNAGRAELFLRRPGDDRAPLRRAFQSAHLNRYRARTI